MKDRFHCSVIIFLLFHSHPSAIDKTTKLQTDSAKEFDAEKVN